MSISLLNSNMVSSSVTIYHTNVASQKKGQLSMSTTYYYCLVIGITVLLSLTVFMLLVAEIMPATSDSVPLIGM